MISLRVDMIFSELNFKLRKGTQRIYFFEGGDVSGEQKVLCDEQFLAGCEKIKSMIV